MRARARSYSELSGHLFDTDTNVIFRGSYEDVTNDYVDFETILQQIIRFIDVHH
jgi:hypothetical protein